MLPPIAKIYELAPKIRDRRLGYRICFCELLDPVLKANDGLVLLDGFGFKRRNAILVRFDLLITNTQLRAPSVGVCHQRREYRRSRARKEQNVNRPHWARRYLSLLRAA